MPKLDVLTFPNPVLRKTCQPLQELDDGILEIARHMADTMYIYKGVGLAASQVGVLKQLIVLDVGEGLITLLNPEITMAEGSETMEEGCLCLPKITVDIERHAKIQVQGIDLQGNPACHEAEDLLARVFQHEIDHLKGTLIIDKLSKLKRDLAVKKYKKLQEEQQKAEP